MRDQNDREVAQPAAPWWVGVVVALGLLALVSVVQLDGGTDGKVPPALLSETTSDTPPSASVNNAAVSTTSAPPPSTAVTTATTPTVIRVPPEGDVPQGWTWLHPGSLSRRSGFASVWSGDRLVVWGGDDLEDASSVNGAVWSPRRVGSGWMEIPQAPVTTSADPTVVWVDDELFVFTGAAGLLDPVEGRWRELAYPPVFPSHPLAGVWTGSEVIMVGYELHPPTFEDNLFAAAYGPDGECCRRLAAPPVDLSYGEAFWTGEEVLLIGGFVDPDGAVASPDGLAGFVSYDPLPNKWETLDSPSRLDARSVAAVWVPESGQLVAIDGKDNSATWSPDEGWTVLPDLPLPASSCTPETATVAGQVFVWKCGQAAVYSPAADRWYSIPTPQVFATSPEVGCGPTGADGRILMWCSAGTDIESALWEIDLTDVEAAVISPPAQESPWELVPNPAAGGREGTSLVWAEGDVWSGGDLLVWGGHGIGSEFYRGWGYIPGSGVWHRIADAPHPGRFGQAAVWTGRQMIVWRGPTTIWDPQRFEWATARFGPQLVAGSAVVWTGAEAIFWGSSAPDDPLGEVGAAYTPDTDTWRELPKSALLPRFESVVAWSGDEMYVWGGTGYDLGAPQDGAAYNPDSDTWRLLPPLPEQIHLARPTGAWSNEEFIVFGANRHEHQHPDDPAGQPPVAGAAYSPQTDSWRIIADFPIPVEPAERLAGAMSAISTGHGIAIWLAAPYFADETGIALYNPDTDSWDLQFGAPASTRAPQLAWTGNSVVALTDEGLVTFTP